MPSLSGIPVLVAVPLLFGHGGRGTLLISRRTPTVTGAASLLLPRLQVSSRSRPQGSSAVSLTGEEDDDSPHSTVDATPALTANQTWLPVLHLRELA